MGILGGTIGTAEVVADAASGIELRFTSAGDPAPQLDVELVLAMPRPKALARVIEACAAFAIRRESTRLRKRNAGAAMTVKGGY